MNKNIQIKKRHVSVVIFYDKKHVLLQNRKSINKAGEEWGFFGGSLEEGESPEQALVREVGEELGYKIKDYRYIGEYENQYFNKKTQSETIVKREIFISSITTELMGKKVVEGDGFDIFTLDEAMKLKIIPGDIEVLKIFKQYRCKDSSASYRK